MCPQEIVILKCIDGSLDVIDSFRFLGNVISKEDGAFESKVARLRTSWKRFRVLLLLLLATKVFLSKRRGDCLMLALEL